MSLETIAALAKYGPMIFSGIREGLDIYERLRAGDLTAEEAAKDWLGVAGNVEQAIQNWEASKE